MQTERFKNEMEFKKAMPSELYVCTNCGELLSNPTECNKCGFRADGLFKTMDRGYKYEIEETGEKCEIFTRIERITNGTGSIEFFGTHDGGAVSGQ